jgi:hypothetical protein
MIKIKNKNLGMERVYTMLAGRLYTRGRIIGPCTERTCMGALAPMMRP